MIKKILLTVIFSFLIFLVLPDVSFGQTYNLNLEFFNSSGTGVVRVYEGTNLIQECSDGASCTISLSAGSNVSLRVAPTSNRYYFLNWSGACETPVPTNSNDNPFCSFVIESDSFVGAHFRHCDKSGGMFAQEYQRCMIVNEHTEPVVVAPEESFELVFTVRRNSDFDYCDLYQADLGDPDARGCLNQASLTRLQRYTRGSLIYVDGLATVRRAFPAVTESTPYCLRCTKENIGANNWDKTATWVIVDSSITEPGGPGEPTCENCDLTVTVVAHNSQGTVVGSDAFSGLTPSPCTATNNTASCTATTTGGAVGTLTAQPGSGGEFGWWEGACGSETSRNTNPVCTLTMNSHLSAVAYFFREGEVPPENGGGGGPWTPPGPGGPGTYWPPPIPPGPGDWLINPIGMQCDDIFSCLLGMSYFLFWITMPLFIIAIIIGAFYMMFSAGDEKKYSRGKQIITYALVAFAIVLVAFGIPILIAEIFSGG